jgi:hypothetical protein
VTFESGKEAFETGLVVTESGSSEVADESAGEVSRSFGESVSTIRVVSDTEDEVEDSGDADDGVALKN